MKIAYTMTEGKGELDRLLADFAAELAAKGVRTRGIVQINSDCEPSHRCDMDVQILPDGDRIRISQFLGKESKGCRLNPEALEQAVVEVGKSMQDPFDIFILNKFGKQESDGRGFRDLVAHALAEGAHVIAGVNGMNRQNFEDFSGGIATYVPPEPGALMAWYDPDPD
ncbi:DUF2478 domain-containing protein [Shimia sp. SDUM112013]|uniref:DUF2478 domain-containing protein n=1 Tax=Shimia sp. SDUM112013 TaxID=3136160 RepID=UPI0032F02CE1